MRTKRIISIVLIIFILLSLSLSVLAEAVIPSDQIKIQTKKYYLKDENGNDIEDRWFEYYITDEKLSDNDIFGEKLLIVNFSKTFNDTLEIPEQIDSKMIKHVFVVDCYEHIKTIKLSNVTKMINFLHGSGMMPSVEKLIIGDGFDFELQNYLNKKAHFVLGIKEKYYAHCPVAFLPNIRYELLPECSNYMWEDNVLFSANKTVIFKYQNEESRDEYFIPEGVTKIHQEAFAYVKNLQSVIFSRSIECIGKRAFNNADISIIDMNDNLKRISAGAFRGSHICEIEIPKGVEYIGNYAFAQSTLKKVTFKTEKLTTLEENLKDYNEKNDMCGWFYGCRELENVELPANLEVIPEKTFCGCAKLKKIDLPNGLKKIRKRAFESCIELTEIKFPKKLKRVGLKAFANCSKIGYIIVPKNVKEIGSYAFFNCSKISSVSFEKGIKVIGGSSFEYCESLRKITIPKKVKLIGDDAFKDCISLRKVIIKAKKTKFVRKALLYSWVRYKYGDSYILTFDTNPNSVIIAPKKSTAQKYAKKHGIKFKAINV